MIRKHRGMIAYLMVLTVFTIYVGLDTFVITRVYGDAAVSETYSGSGTYMTEDEEDALETVVSDNQTAQTAKSTSTAEAVITDSSYEDDNISVTLTEYREYDTTVYVADVTLSSPEYLRTALAQGVYGRNVKQATSEMAEENGAILAINGDYYGAREAGYVIKNGTLYRDEAQSGRETLVIYEDGSFEIVSEDEVSAQELLNRGAVQTMSFGPALVEGGNIAVGENEEVGQSMASNPRTAIGIIDKNHYVFVVSDGRTDESAGLSLYELAGIMKELGCTTAYNLDGGGSSTMYFNGETVNTPTGGRAGHGTGSERSVSDIVYIGY